jgi:hypothetical protein
VRWSPNEYRLTALERLHDADAARRAERFGVGMYLSGVAAECMLRAYHHDDRPFDERHDIVQLFQACDLERLGDDARRLLRGPILTIQMLWRNDLRFAHEEMIRLHLHRTRLDRNVHREANPVKVKTVELYNACYQVVSLGESRWDLN